MTTGELLNGERGECPAGQVQASIDNALVYGDKSAKSKMKSFQNTFAIGFSGLLLAVMAVCLICDLAVSGSLTWPLFPHIF